MSLSAGPDLKALDFPVTVRFGTHATKEIPQSTSQAPLSISADGIFFFFHFFSALMFHGYEIWKGKQ